MTNESPYINNSLIGSSDDEIFYLNSIRKGLLDECNCGDPEELCAMDIAIEAVKSKSSAEEYRTPKKVRISVDDYGTCPTCGNVMRFDGSYRYCNECGQALDWSNREVKDGKGM